AFSGRFPAADSGRTVVPGNCAGAVVDRGNGPLARLQGSEVPSPGTGLGPGPENAMSCREIYQKLLTAESPAAPGPEVQEHLKTCGRCGRRRRRLLRLNRETQNLPLPVETPRAKACFLQMLDHLEARQAAASTPPVPQGGSRLTAYLVAAAVLLVPAL